jgi:hypothetical protein
MIRSIFAAGTAVFVCFAFAAHAQDCGPLKKLISLDLTSAPNGVSSIPVTINGSPRKLQFDTAGGRSVLSAGAADSLGLHAISGNMKLLDRAGNASQRAVTIDSLVIGGQEIKNVAFQIHPNPNFGSNPQLPTDGALANDILKNYDLDMDFAGGKISYFLLDHCDGHVVYWTTAPASAIPFRYGQPGSFNNTDTHIRFHVMLDGKDLQAVLNTSSPRSQMSARIAETYGVKEDSQGTVPLGQFDGRKVFGYVFKNLAFGDVSVSNPHVAILPDVIGRNDPNNAVRANSRIKRADDDLEPDITIGMDVIRRLHIYVAAKEAKLYITAADKAPNGQ